MARGESGEEGGGAKTNLRYQMNSGAPLVDEFIALVATRAKTS